MPYIQQRKPSNIYYLRVRIPSQFVPVTGVSIFKTSLKTRDKKTAIDRASLPISLIKQLRFLSTMRLTRDTLDKITRIVITDLITWHKTEWMGKNHTGNPDEAEWYTGQMINSVSEEIVNKDYTHGRVEVAELLVKREITYDSGPLLDTLADAYNRNALELYEADIKAWSGDIIGSTEALDKVTARATPLLEPILQNYQSPKEEEDKGKLITDLMDKFIKTKSTSGEWDKPADRSRECELAFKKLIWILPDDVIHIEGITKGLIRDARNVLLQLPKRFKIKEGQTADEALDEVQEDDLEVEDLIMPTTVRKCMGWWGNFLNWCFVEDYFPTHGLVDKLKPKDSREQDEIKVQFSPEQLVQIFTQKEYVRGDFKQHFHYWLPLLAAYSGGRISELCGLYPGDVREIAGVWVINIEKNEHRSLKNKGSRRVVPIHSRLIKLGFLEYVTFRKDEKLLLDMNIGNEGKISKLAGSWFSDRKKALEDFPRIVTFHSFRHGFKGGLRFSGEVMESVSNALMGHVEKGSGGDYGNPGVYAKKLEEAVERVVYPELDQVLPWCAPKS